MVLVLSRSEVIQLIDVCELIGVIEKALVSLSQGESRNPNRLRIFVQERQAMMACMPAYLGSAGLLGAKVVNGSDKAVTPGTPRNLSSVLVLGDTDGRYLAVMGGTLLTPARTAATSAIAIRELSRKDAAVMAIIGCGVQGRAELAGAACVRKLSEVVVFDTGAGVAETFRREMELRTGIPIRIARTADEAAAAADIVTLATTAEAPVISDGAIRPGTHVNAVGAHTLQTRELQSDTIARCRLYVESRVSMRAEAGDVMIPIAEGRITENHVLGELGELIGKRVEARRDDREITVFKSTGLAVEDLCAAKLVYERALARKVGVNIEI